MMRSKARAAAVMVFVGATVFAGLAGSAAHAIDIRPEITPLHLDNIRIEQQIELDRLHSSIINDWLKSLHL